ncbi:MAG: hypothetical protein HOQ43_00915 [Glycomyces artemisiae]|uniref:Uncharacterized protein n=1 Tax=Glycomyces artemisiae TaxID=1076443 RepID=A0A850BXT4_9ACTN|nr:hypothetical protein [Glycomyces artemisiae]
MLRFYRVWNFALGALIGIQFFLAGYGALGTGSPDEAFALHIMNGRLIGAVALLGVLFAALARAGGKLIGASAIILGLVVLQSVIALISVAGTVPGQIIFGFHVVNALIIEARVGATGKLAKKILDDRAAARGTAAEPVAA